MTDSFRQPEFSNKNMELRFDDKEICIYMTREGLLKLIDICSLLLNNPHKGHVHLEDYQILTKESLRCTIAVFE